MNRCPSFEVKTPLTPSFPTALLILILSLCQEQGFPGQVSSNLSEQRLGRVPDYRVTNLLQNQLLSKPGRTGQSFVGMAGVERRRKEG